MLFETISEARDAAERLSGLHGVAHCIVSGRMKGQLRFRILPLEGFGLPRGGTLEEIIEPEVERRIIESSEKTSANGF